MADVPGTRRSPPDCTDPPEAGIASTATITTDVPVGAATSVLYVGGGDSKVYALNAATGAVLWSYTVGANPDYFVWSSPAVFGNSVYIGVASFGDCPLVQGQLLQLNRITGALQNTFNVVPNGCTGGGVWGSPTIDAAAGTIYFNTGNAGDCTSSEPLAPAVCRGARLRPEPGGLVVGAPRAAEQTTATSGRHRRCSTVSSAGSRSLLSV